MKKIIFPFLIMLLFSFSVSAQKKVYFDANWEITIKEKAVYYRDASITKGKNELLTDYYISGKKAKEFFLIKGKNEGKFSMFYESGELMVSGRYDNDKKNGMWKTYSKNGKIIEKGKYKKGEKSGVWKTFYKNR